MQDIIDAIAERRLKLREIAEELFRLENEFALIAGDMIKDAYKEKGDPFGIAHVYIGNTKVKVTAPKKVTWDQDALRELSSSIAQAGEDPDEYIKVSFDVSETKYNAWPEDIRAAFEPARTVAPGKMRFEFEGDE